MVDISRVKRTPVSAARSALAPAGALRREVSEASAQRAWGRLATIFMSDKARPALREAADRLDRPQALAEPPAATPAETVEIAEAVIGALEEDRETFDALTPAEQAVVLTLLWEEISDAKRTRGFVSLAFWELLGAASAAAGGGRAHDTSDADRRGADLYGTDAPKLAVARQAAPVAPVMADGITRTSPEVARQAQILRTLAAALPVKSLSDALTAQAARLTA